MNLVFLRTQTLCRAYVCFTVLFCTCHFAVGTVELFRSMRCRAANFGRQRNVVGLIFSVAPRQFSLTHLLVGFFFSTNCFTCIFVFFLVVGLFLGIYFVTGWKIWLVGSRGAFEPCSHRCHARDVCRLCGRHCDDGRIGLRTWGTLSTIGRRLLGARSA